MTNPSGVQNCVFMLLGLVLSMALSATPAGPSVAVLVGRRTVVSRTEAHALAQALSGLLGAASLPLAFDGDAAQAELARLGLTEAAQCSGRRACLCEVGRQLGVSHLVVVSVSDVGDDRSIALELLRVADGVAEEADALILSPKLSPKAALTSGLVSGFVERVRVRFSADAGRPGDAPVVEKTAQPRPGLGEDQLGAMPIARVQSAAAAPRARLVGIVLAAAGGLALGAATVLMVDGASSRSAALRAEAVDGALRSPYPGSEVQARLGQAQVELGIGAGAAALAAGLGVAAVLAW